MVIVKSNGGLNVWDYVGMGICSLGIFFMAISMLATFSSIAVLNAPGVNFGLVFWLSVTGFWQGYSPIITLGLLFCAVGRIVAARRQC